VGNYPTGVSVNPSGTAVYVANTDDNTVSAIDTTSNTVAATVPVGSLPSALGIFIGPALAPAPAPAPTPVPDPIPPLGGVPGVLGIGTQPTVLDLGKSQGPAMTNCLLATVRSLFGADVQYRGESPNGVVTFSLGDSTLSLYATQASIYTAQSLGIHVTDSNALTVVTSCGTFTIAPAVANLAEFGAVLNAMGLQANISAQGVITVVAGTTVYVARPDYVVTRSTASVAPGTPSLTRVADGSYRFTDSSGSVQALVPAFVDTGGLASQAPLALALGGWILIQTDGKALFTAFSGLQYVLTPDMTLTAAPAADAALLCWQDAPNHYLFRSSTLLQAQGFTALR
jgi:YVTN family beta-propeller protein